MSILLCMLLVTVSLFSDLTTPVIQEPETGPQAGSMMDTTDHKDDWLPSLDENSGWLAFVRTPIGVCLLLFVLLVGTLLARGLVDSALDSTTNEIPNFYSALRIRLGVSIGGLGCVLACEWFFNCFASISSHLEWGTVWVVLCLLTPIPRNVSIGTSVSWELYRIVSGSGYLSTVLFGITLAAVRLTEYSELSPGLLSQVCRPVQVDTSFHSFSIDIGLLRILAFEIWISAFLVLWSHRHHEGLFSTCTGKPVLYGNLVFRVSTRWIILASCIGLLVFIGATYRGERFSLEHLGTTAVLSFLGAIFFGRKAKAFSISSDFDKPRPARASIEVQSPEEVIDAINSVPIRCECSKSQYIADMEAMQQLVGECTMIRAGIEGEETDRFEVRSSVEELVAKSNQALNLYRRYVCSLSELDAEVAELFRQFGGAAKHQIGRLELPTIEETNVESLAQWVRENADGRRYVYLVGGVPDVALTRLKHLESGAESDDETEGVLTVVPPVETTARERSPDTRQETYPQRLLPGRVDPPLKQEQSSAPEIDFGSFELGNAQYNLFSKQGTVVQATNSQVAIQLDTGPRVVASFFYENGFRVGEFVGCLGIGPFGKQSGPIVSVYGAKYINLDLRHLNDWIARSLSFRRDERISGFRQVLDRHSIQENLRSEFNEADFKPWRADCNLQQCAFRFLLEVTFATKRLSSIREPHECVFKFSVHESQIIMSKLMRLGVVPRGVNVLGFTAPKRWLAPASLTIQ